MNHVDQVCTLKLSGPVRLAEVQDLLVAARQVADTGADVTVDLSAAEHLHTAAAQALLALSAHVARAGRVFRLADPSPSARDALTWIGAWTSMEGS